MRWIQKSCRSAFMLMVLLRARASFLNVSARGLGRANWVSSSSSQSHTTRYHLSRGDSGADDDQVNGAHPRNTDSRQPRTGWNHNQPGRSSNFWQDPSSSNSGDSSPTDNTRGILRTGWLHNTEPRRDLEESTKAASSAAAASKSSPGTSTSISTPSPARRRLELAMKQDQRQHRILSPPAFHAGGGGRRLAVTEHVISVPIYRGKDERTITSEAPASRLDVYFCIVEKVKTQEDQQALERLNDLSPRQRADAYVKGASMVHADDMMLYLQGGPGFGAPTPLVNLALSTKDGSWAARALETENISRVVLLDQRGTGRSTPITKQTLQIRFPDLFLLDQHASGSDSQLSLDQLNEAFPNETERVKQSVVEATHFLAQFRGDRIVQDAEEVRDALLLPPNPEKEDDKANRVDNNPLPWGCCLGQSFGGFCLMTYLSLIPHPPKICLFTGGIAPMLTDAFNLYISLWDRVKERNLRYYDRYPGDIKVVKTIVKKLLEEPATLPSGGRLTARRFLQLGLGLGGSPSTFPSLHALLSAAFVDGIQGDEERMTFSRAFLKRIESEQSFDEHPIYFWLHEPSCYANGLSGSPTAWAAHRAHEEKIRQLPEFDYRVTSALDSDDQPTLFFGEMVFPWMAEDFSELEGVGLTAVAQALAVKDDWGPLYVADQMKEALTSGASRAACVVYHDDMYVDFDSSMKVLARGGPLEKCKVWVTNEYQHSGLRDAGSVIFSKLYGMATGSVIIPS